ncbi:MAG TPA: Do family serine endopeptidase [Bacteroidales bacterium]|nr:Do family serine endopeptidase [Bacteroidales bacterium]
MKTTNRFGYLILAAVLGSAITMGTGRLLDRSAEKSVRIEHMPSAPVMGAAYTVNSDGDIVPLEFTDVSEKVMPAVVHIRSSREQNYEQYRGQSPEQFKRFFDDDLFKYFFGPQFRNESPQPRKRQPQNRQPRKRMASGSGVIISEEGYIVTNNHVIDGADEIEVILNDNREFKAKVVGTDPSTDLALIQIRENDLSYLPLVNSDDVRVGEWVLAVGNPFNLNSTVTAGIVSAKGRNINILRDQSAIESFIQTDAAINPGNSGGALVNLQGGLIGINTAIASPTGAYAGYGFAVPSNIVGKVVEDLMKYGMVQRGYLGLMIRSVDGSLSEEKDLDVTTGVYVDSVTLNSAAGDAGIKVGDVITEVQGSEVKTSAELLEMIARYRPGDKVSLQIDRDGKVKEYKVTLRNQEGKEEMIEKDARDVLDILGAEITEIDKGLADQLSIESGLQITKLRQGLLKKETDVRAGFIITKVDGKSIKSVDAFVRYLEGREGGVMLEGVYEDYPGKYYYAFGL